MLVGVPAGTGRGGGRKEADVVGFKFEGSKLVIEHWEVSSLSLKGEDAAERIRKKFSSDSVEVVRNYIIKVLGLSNKQALDVEYRKKAIVFTSEKALRKAKEILKNEGIELYSIKEFFEVHLKPVIEEQVKSGRTFPDPCWLLNMLYTLRKEEIVNW